MHGAVQQPEPNTSHCDGVMEVHNMPGRLGGCIQAAVHTTAAFYDAACSALPCGSEAVGEAAQAQATRACIA
jgi:hypothetical protein